MLRSFRENIKGRMGKVLLAIIIVPFVLFGAESLLTGGGGAAKVLDVNGEEIDALRLAQEVVLLRNEMASRMGENVDYEQLSDDRLTPLARQRLTQSTLIKQNFEQLGLATPDSMLQQTIIGTPEFQVDGKFSNERMTRVLADTGFNLNILKSRLAEDLRSNQLRAGIGQSGFATTQNTELLLNIINESRKINWVALELEQVQGDLQISDSEIADYYDANSSEFYTELRVDAEFLLIDQQALQQPVESAAVLAEYNSQQAQFESSERRELAHILLEINQQQSEAQAREKAQQAIQRHREGASFAELAAEISQDPGTAKEGGLLGYAEQDGSFPPAFEQAAFALQPGEVSEPVLTDAGIHLIKVIDIEKDEMPPFSELKPVIETQLAQRAARKLYVQQMEEARDIAFNAADLQEPADALGLAVQRVDSIAREGLHAGVNQAATAGHQHGGMAEQIFADSRVLAALFSEEVLQDRMNSELIELNDTQGVLVRVASTHEPRQLALSEVRDTIEARLREVKAREKARALAVSLRDQVREGANFAKAVKAAKSVKLQPNIDVEVTRQGSELPAELIEAVFAAPRSRVSGGVGSAATSEADASEGSEQGSAGSTAVGVVALANGDQVVYQVREVGQAQSEFTDEQLALFARQAGSALARQELNGYLESLNRAAEINQF